MDGVVSDTHERHRTLLLIYPHGEIVENIAECLGLESESLAGLEKAPKATLKTIERVLSE